MWGSAKFSETSKSFQLEGTLLSASCDRGDGVYVKATLDLKEHITYITPRGCFEPIIPDAEFTELMASASWMNVAVITNPDMRAFLTNPTFQRTIKAAAQRAVEEVINEMQEAMSLAVANAVAMVSHRSEEYVRYEMESLTKRATLFNAGPAYCGPHQLTMMSDVQSHAYKAFAPYIAPRNAHHAALETLERGNTFDHRNGHIAALQGPHTLEHGHTAVAHITETTRKGTPTTPGK